MFERIVPLFSAAIFAALIVAATDRIGGKAVHVVQDVSARFTVGTETPSAPATVR